MHELNRKIRAGLEPELRGDLAQGGRVPPGADFCVNEIQHALLGFGQSAHNYPGGQYSEDPLSRLVGDDAGSFQFLCGGNSTFLNTSLQRGDQRRKGVPTASAVLGQQ